MAGITAAGFEKKTLAQVKSELEDSWRGALGNTLNVQPPSLASILIGISAEREAALWDMAEELAQSRSASGAQGVLLDNVGELVAVERLGGVKSKTLKQIFFGDVGTVIPTSLIVSVSGNADAKFSPRVAVTLAAGTDEVQKLTFSSVPDAGTWTIEFPDGGITAVLAFGANAAAVQAAIRLLDGWEDVTVSGDYAAGFTVTFTGSSGLQPWGLMTPHSSVTHLSGAVTITPSELTLGVAQGTGIMDALEDGPTVAVAGTLSVIETPVTGLTSTKNLDDATQGRLEETDSEYRIRRDAELQAHSTSTVEAIRIALKSVADVQEAIVYQNDTDSTDGNSVPPHAIHAYVDGGADQDIADKLWGATGGGIQTYGSVVKTVTDSQGLSQTLKFDRPVDKPVYTITTVTKGADYPTNGDALVKAAIVAFGATLNIGDDVLLYPKLLPAIVNTVPGIDDIVITLGFAPAPGSSANLAVTASQRATFVTANQTVNSS